jgi:hypothetical protein
VHHPGGRRSTLVWAALLAVSLAPVSAAASPGAVVPDFRLELRRGPCEGFCAVWSVSLDARGALEWNGEHAVATLGAARRTVPPATVAAVIARLERERLLTLRSPKPLCVDTPTVELAVTLRGRSHGLRHELCWERGTAEGRRRATLVRDIERLLDLGPWIGDVP